MCLGNMRRSFTVGECLTRYRRGSTIDEMREFTPFYTESGLLDPCRGITGGLRGFNKGTDILTYKCWTLSNVSFNFLRLSFNTFSFSRGGCVGSYSEKKPIV